MVEFAKTEANFEIISIQQNNRMRKPRKVKKQAYYCGILVTELWPTRPGKLIYLCSMILQDVPTIIVLIIRPLPHTNSLQTKNK